ncbi:toxic anion resistance protein [uncultured Agitococcus sp.]|uniref:toxic anion resistance protein n=1 Tax=uncultured Agitococcus sp. TaxID=1506599 RepID=UPI00261D926E|nr:toxic anion resistance protein [uncultured Agitococcus sp.]
MSKFKPASAFDSNTSSAAPTTTAPVVPEPNFNSSTNHALVTAPEHNTPVVYQAPTQPASYLDMVLAKHEQRLQQEGSDLNKIRAEVAKIAQSFDPRRADAIHTLGSQSGAKVVQYSDKLLSQVKSKDLEGLGDNLNEVVLLAKGINISSLVDSSKSKIPLIGGLIDSFKMNKEKVLGRYESLSKQIEKLIKEMQGSQVRLANRIQDLEKVYTFNVEEYHTLECYILVGEVKIEELRAEIADRQAAPAATNPMEAQAISNLQDVLNRLEKRVHDLRTMQMVAVQTAPMIRMVQSNNQLLIDKFRNLQELTIPSWKKQFTLAVALIEQQKAVELTQKIDDTTNDLMRRNAELLKQNSVNTARANQRAVVDIETLEYVQQTLISTIEEVEQIQRDGEQARADAVIKMESMKGELITKLGGRT